MPQNFLLLVFSSIFWNIFLVQAKSPEVCLNGSRTCVVGKYMPGFQTFRYEAFLGIPYAKPPIGDLRFKNPVKADLWIGRILTKISKKECIQSKALEAIPKVIGAEDCLYLNVYRPSSPSAKNLPVLFYIHDGGFFSGPHFAGPEYFMDTNEVILVVPAYRVGPFGFLSTGDAEMTGNFGLKDQNLALKWVQEHIAAFGGDPTRVTLFGHGTGAAAAHFHTLSPASNGLFQNAILMSGAATGPYAEPLDNPKSQVIDLAIAAGIKQAKKLSSANLVKALQKVEPFKILRAVETLKSWDVYPVANFRPSIEKSNSVESFLTQETFTSLKQNSHSVSVPWIIGNVPSNGEGVAITLRLASDKRLQKEFNRNFNKMLRTVLDLSGNVFTDEVIKRLVSKYMGGVPNLNERTLSGFLELLGDANFIYPTYKAIATSLGAKKPHDDSDNSSKNDSDDSSAYESDNSLDSDSNSSSADSSNDSSSQSSDSSSEDESNKSSDDSSAYDSDDSSESKSNSSSESDSSNSSADSSDNSSAYEPDNSSESDSNNSSNDSSHSSSGSTSDDSSENSEDSSSSNSEDSSSSNSDDSSASDLSSSSEEVTTKATTTITDTTTSIPIDSTTKMPESSTTNSPMESTTGEPEITTTIGPADSTTEADEASTTGVTEVPTTMGPKETTTEDPEAFTTNAPGQSTTDVTEVSTTISPGETTTEEPEAFTTNSHGQSTTDVTELPTTTGIEDTTVDATDHSETDVTELPITVGPEDSTTDVTDIPTTTDLDYSSYTTEFADSATDTTEASTPNDFDNSNPNARVRTYISETVDNDVTNLVGIIKFDYRGRYSYAKTYSGNFKNADPVHDDDSLFLFKTPSIAPLGYSKRSQEAGLIKRYVGLYVEFAKTGKVKKFENIGSCTKEAFEKGKCNYLSILKDVEPFQTDNKWDIERMQLWKEIYG